MDGTVCERYGPYHPSLSRAAGYFPPVILPFPVPFCGQNTSVKQVWGTPSVEPSPLPEPSAQTFYLIPQNSYPSSSSLCRAQLLVLYTQVSSWCPYAHP